MNSERAAAADLENLHLQFRWAIDMVWAVHECIEYGAENPREYADALFGSIEYLRHLNGELGGIVKALFGKEAGTC